MVKVKTSIYVDKELWSRFKKYARMRGLEVSRLLEEMIGDEMAEGMLDRGLLEMVDSAVYELDFDPVSCKGSVSELVRVMRDERAADVS